MFFNTYRDGIRMIGSANNGPPPAHLPQIIVYNVAIYIRLNPAGLYDPVEIDAVHFLSDPHRLLPWMLPHQNQPQFLGGIPAPNNLIIDTLGPNQNVGKIQVQDEGEQEPDHIFWP